MFFKIVFWTLFIYAVYCGALYLMQRQVLFPSDQIPASDGRFVPAAGIEKTMLDMPFGKVETWFMKPSRESMAPSPVVIFAHGNGELIDFWPEFMDPFTRMGIGVLLVEYPGYGRSEGSPSQDSITQTFMAAYDNLVRRKDVDPRRIIFFGRSVGGGAVCALSMQRPSAAMILMSTFKSVKSFASRFMVPDFLIRDPFDNLEAVKHYEHPLLIIHGQKDELIPFSHGQALYKAAPNAELLAYPCGHNDCPVNSAKYWHDLEGFLAKNALLPH